jgi:amino acid transporter
LSIAELASMFPSAPGIRTYLKAALGSTPSLALVYLYLVFTVLMAGVEGYMFALVVGNLSAVNPLVTTLILIVVVTAINVAGLQLPRSAQMLTTAAALLVLFAASAADFSAPSPVLALDAPKGGAALPSAIGMAVFLYMGFEWATPMGLRRRAYDRMIPRALPLSILLLMVLYLLFAFTAARRVSPGDLAASPIPQAPVYAAIFGHGGAYLVFLLALSATASTFNAGIMGGARLLLMLVNDGYLPKWIGYVSDRSGAPVGATVLLGASAAVTAVMVVWFQLQLVLAVVGAGIMCVVYGAFALAVMVLRRQKPDMQRPYRTPAPRWVQGALVIALPVLGVNALFSLPALLFQVLAWTGAAVAASLLLTLWSVSRTPQRTPTELRT